MDGKQGSVLNKKFAQLALWLFVSVSMAIILIHSFKFNYGLHADMTISKYVGLAYWSAGAFLVSNSIIAWAWMKYAGMVKRRLKMSKMWYVIAVLAALMLVTLSICPMGLYDAVPGELGIVSRLHKLASTSMFVMMIVSALGLWLKVGKEWFKVYTGVYIVYGVVMALMYMLENAWFWGNTLVLESLFLLGYLVMLCIIPENRDENSADVV